MIHVDATTIVRNVHAGEDPLAPARHALARIRAAEDPAVLAIVSDDDLRCDAPDGPLAGVPILLKELGTHAAGLPNREGLSYPPGQPAVAGMDSALVRRLRQAGAVVLGTTATTELGLTARLDGPPGSAPVHPGFPERTPGGSSTGSAVAVAGGLVPIAHGTDGGGSIRLPAAFCGLVGLKPSRGQVSFGPVIGDTLGSLAVNFGLTRTVRDAARLFDVLAGPEPGDPYGGPPLETGGASLAVDGPPARLRVAVCIDVPDGGRTPDSEVVSSLRKVADQLAALGHHVEERRGWVFGDHRTRSAMATVWAGMAAEGARRARAQGAQLGAAAAALAEAGEQLSAGALAEALAQLSSVARRMERKALRDVDLILTPTCPTAPPPVRERGPETAEAILSETLDELLVFTYGANVTGQAAIALPTGPLASGLPSSAQLLGRWGDDLLLLQVAAELDRVGELSAA